MNRYAYANLNPPVYFDYYGHDGAVITAGRIISGAGQVGKGVTTVVEGLDPAVIVAGMLTPTTMANGELPSDKVLQREIEYEANRSEYKNRCSEPEPPNFLTPCDKAKWRLKRAEDCKALRQAMTDRWFNGLEDEEHARHMAQIDREIRNAERAVRWNCDCRK